MFEGLVAGLLVKYLGEYVSGIGGKPLDPKSLELAIWNGDVRLENLELKPGALDSLNLPCEIAFGIVGSLVLKIPWKALKSESVIAEVHDLFVIARPKRGVYDEKEAKENAKKDKESKLKVFETLRQSKEDEKNKKKEEAPQKKGWIGRLVEVIVNNIQVRIANVHVRYEDNLNGIALGVMLKNLNAFSCNEKWERGFVTIKDVTSFFYKTAQLEKLSAYAETECNFLGGLKETEVIVREMRGYLDSSASQAQYLIKPISGKANLKMQRSAKVDVSQPKIWCKILLDRIDFVLNELQYKGVMASVSYLTNVASFERYWRYKPFERPGERRGKGWLKFALMAARKDLLEEFHVFDRVVYRRKVQGRYAKLFRKTKKLPWVKEKITPEETAELQKMEEGLTVDEICYVRNFAYKQIEFEREKHAEKKKEQGWISSWFSRPEVNLSEKDQEEMVKKFNETFVEDEDGESATTAELPPEFVNIQVNFTLQSMKLHLFDVYTKRDIMDAEISKICADFQMSKQMEVDLTLQSFDARDLYTKNSVFPDFIRRSSSEAKSTELAHITFIKDALDGSADIKVSCLLDNLDIVLNLDLIQRIIGFFSLPPSVDLSQVQKLSKEGISSFQKKAQAQLQLALENKPVMDINVEIRAPRFLAPHNCYSEETAIIMVNLGNLKLRSVDVVTKEERLKQLKKQKEDGDIVDFSLYYDNFNVVLDDFCIVFGDYDLWRGGGIGSDRLVERVGVDLTLKKCIMPQSLLCPDIVVMGEIPVVSVNISPRKLETTLVFVNEVQLFLDNPTGKGLGVVMPKKKQSTCSVSISEWQQGEEEESVIEKDISYQVELRSSGHLCFFAADRITGEKSQPIMTVTLCEHTKVELYEVVKLLFGLKITLRGASEGSFFIFRINVENVKEWHKEITKVIRSKITKIVKKEDENEGGEGPEVDKKDMIEKEDLELKKKGEKMKVEFVLREFRVTASYIFHGEMRPLSVFQFRDLAVNFIGRQFDMKVECSLKSISLSDEVDPRNKYILLPHTSESKDVAWVSFISAGKKESELYDPEKGDSMVDVKFEEFHLRFDPRTLSHFLRFVYSLQDALKGLKRPKSYSSVAPDKVEKEETSGKTVVLSATEEELLRPSMYVQAELQKMSVKCLEFSGEFCSAALIDVSVMFSQAKAQTLIEGNIGNLTLDDLTGETIHPHVLGTRRSKEKLMDFDFKILNMLEERKEPVFDKFLKLKVRSVNFVFLMMFIRKLKNFFSRGPIMEVLAEQTKKAGKAAYEAAKKQSKSIKLLKFDIDVSDLQFVCPMSHVSTTLVTGAIRQLNVKNVIKEKFESFDIRIKGLAVDTTMEKVNVPLLEGADLNVDFSRSLIGRPSVTNLGIRLGKARMHMSHEQYQLIFLLLDNNFGDPKGKTCALTAYDKKMKEIEFEEEKENAGEEDKKEEGDDSLMNIDVEFPFLSLALERSSSGLCVLEMGNFTYSLTKGKEQTHIVRVGTLSGVDKRNNDNFFRDFVSTSSGAKKSEVISLDMFMKPSLMKVDLALDSPRILLTMDLFMELKDFFVERYAEKKEKVVEVEHELLSEDQISSEGNVNIFMDTWIGSDIHLSKDRQMFIGGHERILIDGNGFMILMTKEASITVKSSVKYLQFKNTLFNVEDPQDVQEMRENLKFFKLESEDTVVTFGSIDGCIVVHMDMEELEELKKRKIEREKKKKEEKKREDDQHQALDVHGVLRNTSIILPSDLKAGTCKQFQVYLKEADIKFDQTKESESGKFSLNHLELRGFFEKERDAVEHILKPVSLLVKMSREMDQSIPKRNIKLNVLSNLEMKLVYQDVKMITGIVDDLKGEKKEEEEEEKGKTKEIKTEDGAVVELFHHHDDQDWSDDESHGYSTEEEDEGEDDEFHEVVHDSTQAIKLSFFDLESKDVAKTEEVVEVTEKEVEVDEEKEEKEEMKPLEERDANEFEYEDEENEEDKPAEKKKKISIPDSKTCIDVETGSSKISILAVDDVRGFDIPLIEVKVAIEKCNVMLQSGSTNRMEVGTTLRPSIEYYNRRVADWEPLLEEVNLSVEYESSPIEKRGEESGESEEGEEKKEDSSQLIRVTNDAKPMNITVTQSMLETIKHTQAIWSADFTKEESETSEEFSAYLVRNHSGYPLKMWIKGHLETEVAVEDGKELGVNFDDLVNVWKNVLNVVFKLVLPEGSNMDDEILINVKKSCRKMVESTDDNVVGCKGFVDVELKEGRKIITIRSGVVVVNDTKLDWNLGVYQDNVLHDLGKLRAGRDRGIPIPLIKGGYLAILPIVEEVGNEGNGETEEIEIAEKQESEEEKEKKKGPEAYTWSCGENGEFLNSHFAFSKILCDQQPMSMMCKNADSRRSEKGMFFVTEAKFLDDRGYKLFSSIKGEEGVRGPEIDIDLVQSFNPVISVRTPFAVENLLPYPVSLEILDIKYLDHLNDENPGILLLKQLHLKRGGKVDLHEVNLKNNLLMRMSVIDDKKKEIYRTHKDVVLYSPEGGAEGKCIIRDECENELEVQIANETKNGDSFREISLFVPYWIVNHTGYDLLAWRGASKSNILLPGQHHSCEAFSTSDVYVKRSPLEFSDDDPFLIEFKGAKFCFLTVPNPPKSGVVYGSGFQDFSGNFQKWIFKDGKIIMASQPEFRLQAFQQQVIVSVHDDSLNALQTWTWNDERMCLVNTGNNMILNHGGKGAVNLSGKPTTDSQVRFIKAGRFFFDTLEVEMDYVAAEEKEKEEEDEKEKEERVEGKQFLMYTFPESVSEKKLAVSINESNVSPTFSVDNVGVPGNVNVVSGERKYEVGLYSSLAPGKYKRTKIVTFSTRVRIVNNTKKTLHLRQEGTTHDFVVEANHRLNLFWPSQQRKDLFLMKIEKYEFSTPIDPFQGLGEFHVLMRRDEAYSDIPDIYILTASLKMSGGTIFVVISNPDEFPFLLHNKSEYDLSVAQSSVSKSTWFDVKAHQKVRFCWSNTNKAKKVTVKMMHTTEVVAKKIDFNKIKHVEHSETSGRLFRFEVFVKGATKILVMEEITKEERKKRKEKEKELEEAEEKTFLKAVVQLSEIGVSLVNNTPLEILYVCLRGIDVGFESLEHHTNIFFTLHELQFDDQSDENTLIPIVLSHEKLPEDPVTGKERPVIQLSVCQSKDSFWFFKYLSFNIQEISVKVDFAFVNRIYECVNLFTSKDEEADLESEKYIDEMRASIDSGSLEVKEKKITMMYFGVFELHPIKINLTFKFSKQKTSFEKNPIFLVLDTLGFTLVNCEDAPLKFNKLEMTNFFAKQEEVFDKIGKHYIAQITRELYKIVGSLDIIGNPVGLFNDVSSGAADLFYEPFKARTLDPKKMSQAMVSGASSFINKTIHGTFTTASKVTRSVSKGIGMLTLDEDYQKRMETLSKKPTSLLEGLRQGGRKLGESLIDGATGIFVKPIVGVRKRGALGFFTGIGLGVIGIPTKPIVGIFEFASKTSEGMTSFGAHQMQRKRCIRTFRPDGCVVPFDPFRAFMSHVLKNIKNIEETVLLERPRFFYEFNKGIVLMLTHHSLMKIKMTTLTMKWRIPLRNIISVRKMGNGELQIKYKIRKKKFVKVFNLAELAKEAQERTGMRMRFEFQSVLDQSSGLEDEIVREKEFNEGTKEVPFQENMKKVIYDNLLHELRYWEERNKRGSGQREQRELD